MNREEAIEALTRIKWVYVGNELFEAEKEQAIEIAIEALDREPSENGTLEIKVEDATKIGRVLISDDKHRGGLYYPDEDEPKGEDLISRAEAIEAIEIVDWYHQNQKKDMVHGANDDEHQAWYKADDVYKALEAVPSADRPRGEWVETAQDYYETVNKKGGGVNENTEYFTDDIACPNCLAKFSNIDNETERFNFCPNCGADMRGDTK